MSVPNWLASLLVVCGVLTLSFAIWTAADLIDRYEKSRLVHVQGGKDVMLPSSMRVACSTMASISCCQEIVNRGMMNEQKSI